MRKKVNSECVVENVLIRCGGAFVRNVGNKRPDIAYVVCKLSRYTSNPSQDHWKAIGRVFGYFKRTRQLALYYDHFPTILEGYSDASWINGSSDSKSTTGWIFTLGGGAVC
ncbi:hypothetical protein Tco_1532822 [Tanacetum coccineum]